MTAIKEIIKRLIRETILFRFYVKWRIRQKTRAVFANELKAFRVQNMDAAASKKGEEARIAGMYHVIEKGLTMPDRRLGFGQLSVVTLAKKIAEFRALYGTDNAVCRHAESVLAEYLVLHETENYALEPSVKSALDEVFQKRNVAPASQLRMTAERFWSENRSDFAKFSSSRHCVRSYGKGSVSIEDIKAAVELANNAPSACNRQPCKVYSLSDSKKMSKLLEIQGGNRGFGHLADKLLVLTCDRRTFMHMDPMSVYVNGGIYLMNLSYALHFYKIACCILAWAPTPKNDKLTHRMLGIDKAEAIIALLSCGVLPDEFMLASSPRKSADETFAEI